jgi:hypothetical protein
MKLELIHGNIILTVNFGSERATKILSRWQTITLMGYAGVLYYNEDSLFSMAYHVFSKMDEAELLEFIAYEDVDWDNMDDYVQSLYYIEQENLVNCRKN